VNEFYSVERREDTGDGEPLSREYGQCKSEQWRRIAYSDITRRLCTDEPERANRSERVAELLGLEYFKRKDNDRCSIEV
jgi:hypothetical protein